MAWELEIPAAILRKLQFDDVVGNVDAWMASYEAGDFAAHYNYLSAQAQNRLDINVRYAIRFLTNHVPSEPFEESDFDILL